MSGGERKLLGRWGEGLVAEDLRKKGCRILAANWQCRMGEIDLIVADKRYLRFIEVKLRKQDRIRVTAQLYLAGHPTTLQPRFDVAEVYAPEGVKTRTPRINYIENAFF